MSSAVGERTIFGLGQEVTWGEPVTPTRFHEFLSESLHLVPNDIQSNGISGGANRNARLGSRRQRSDQHAEGDVTFEVGTKGFGILLKHILGATPVSAQQAATTAYLHTFNLGTQLGKSLTLQKQIRDGAGNALATLTYPGSKCTEAEFSISAGNLLQLRTSWHAKDELDDEDAAAQSLLASRPFSFSQGTLLFDDVEVATVSEASVTVTNALNVERIFLGNQGRPDEQTDNGHVEVTGSLTAEFFDKPTFYNRFKNDTATELVLEFVGNTIASTYKETFRITVPEIHLTGDSPQVGSAETLTVTVPWMGLAPAASTSAIKFEYMSTDVTI